MEEKRQGKTLVVALVLFILISLVTSGYIVYDKVLNKTEVKKVKKVNKEKEIKTVVYNTDDEKVSGLIDNLLVIRECDELEDYVKDKKVEVTDISNQKAYLIAEKNELFNSKKESFSLEEVNNIIAKYLGKDYKFDPKSVNYKSADCPSYNYDDSTKMFKKQETACGWTCGPMSSYKITKAVDTDGVLKLDVKVIFASLDQGKDGMYSDYNKTNKIGTFEDEKEDLFAKGSNYQFEFKLEDGNYVFVSSYPVD